MLKEVQWSILTHPLNGGRAFSKHAKSSVHDFSVEPPGRTIISKCNVFSISGQNVCSYLWNTHGTQNKSTKDSISMRGEAEDTQRETVPTVLGLPANIFPFFSRISLACTCWLTMTTLWEPIISEYVCPYFFWSSLRSTWGGCWLRKLSRLPIKGSAGRWGGSWEPNEDLTFSCHVNTTRTRIAKTIRKKQAISVSGGSWRSDRIHLWPCMAGRSCEGRLRAHAVLHLYATTSRPKPWLWLLNQTKDKRHLSDEILAESHF